MTRNSQPPLSKTIEIVLPSPGTDPYMPYRFEIYGVRILTNGSRVNVQRAFLWLLLGYLSLNMPVPHPVKRYLLTGSAPMMQPDTNLALRDSSTCLILVDMFDTTHYSLKVNRFPLPSTYGIYPVILT